MPPKTDAEDFVCCYAAHFPYCRAPFLNGKLFFWLQRTLYKGVNPDFTLHYQLAHDESSNFTLLLQLAHSESPNFTLLLQLAHDESLETTLHRQITPV